MYMYCTSLITLPDHVIRVSSCIYKAVGHAFAPNVVCWSLYYPKLVSWPGAFIHSSCQWDVNTKLFIRDALSFATFNYM